MAHGDEAACPLPCWWFPVVGAGGWAAGLARRSRPLPFLSRVLRAVVIEIPLDQPDHAIESMRVKDSAPHMRPGPAAPRPERRHVRDHRVPGNTLPLGAYDDLY